MSNAFKTALRGERAQIGLWLSLAEPYTAEVCATAGFDWLLIDGEHAPNGVRSVLAQLQAVAAYPAHAVVRVLHGDTALIKQALDLGAQTLLVPMVDTAAQAAAAAAATRYPPRGVRGVGAAVARASRWSARPRYLDEADDEVCLLVQVESVTALAHLRAICAVDGVHGVFIGPADLSTSMGHRGDAGHPDVVAAIGEAIATIVASGKAAGILATDAAAARRWLGLGARFVAVGVDVLLLAQAARRLAADFAPAAGGADPAAAAAPAVPGEPDASARRER